MTKQWIEEIEPLWLVVTAKYDEGLKLINDYANSEEGIRIITSRPTRYAGIRWWAIADYWHELRNHCQAWTAWAEAVLWKDRISFTILLIREDHEEEEQQVYAQIQSWYVVAIKKIEEIEHKWGEADRVSKSMGLRC